MSNYNFDEYTDTELLELREDTLQQLTAWKAIQKLTKAEKLQIERNEDLLFWVEAEITHRATT